MVDQDTIDRVAAAIDSVDVGYSMRLTRLVDGVSTYILAIDGRPAEEFVDNDDASATDQAYASLRAVKQRAQAEAVIAALNTAPTPQPIAHVSEWTARQLRLGHEGDYRLTIKDGQVALYTDPPPEHLRGLEE